MYGVLEVLFILELNDDGLKFGISVCLNINSNNGKGHGDKFVHIRTLYIRIREYWTSVM